MKNDASVDSFTSSDVESGKFGFCGRCHDMFDDVGKVEDGAIAGWYVRIGGQKIVAACMTVRFGLTEVTSIAVCSKNHVAGMIGDNSIFLHG